MTLTSTVREWARARRLDVADVVEFACERAAIREHLAGMSREEAEKLALLDVIEFSASR